MWLGESGENDNKWYRNATRLMEKNDIGWVWWPLKKIGSNNPMQVEMPPEFANLIQYWKGEGARPSGREAYRALVELAKNYKTENISVQYDVLDALINNDASENEAE